MEGLRRLLKAQKFSYDKDVEEVAAIYKARTAPGGVLREFMTAATLKAPQEKILKDDIWAAYLGWCLETGDLDIGSKEELFRDLYKNYPVKPSHSRHNGQQAWFIRGISFSGEGVRLKNLGLSNSPLCQPSLETGIEA